MLTLHLTDIVTSTVPTLGEEMRRGEAFTRLLRPASGSQVRASAVVEQRWEHVRTTAVRLADVTRATLRGSPQAVPAAGAPRVSLRANGVLAWEVRADMQIGNPHLVGTVALPLVLGYVDVAYGSESTVVCHTFALLVGRGV